MTTHKISVLSHTTAMKLAQKHSETVVSVYFPVHSAPPENKKNAVRLDNLLRDAEKVLSQKAKGKNESVSNTFKEIIKGFPTPSPEHKGVALFLSEKGSHLFFLPYPVAENVFVDHHFYLLPLLPLLEKSQEYLVLALSQEQAQLYKASAYAVEKYKTDVAQQSLKSIKGNTEFPADLGYHASSRAGKDRPNIQHHAQGESPDDYHQKQLEQYTQGVAKETHTLLARDDRPLVVVAEPNLLGMFYKHCQYRHLTKESISKSPERLKKEDLLSETHAIVENILSQPKKEMAERFRANYQRAERNARIEPDDIKRHLEKGKVTTILFRKDHTTGSLDENSVADIENEIACLALQKDCPIMVVEKDLLPEGADIGAFVKA